MAFVQEEDEDETQPGVAGAAPVAGAGQAQAAPVQSGSGYTNFQDYQAVNPNAGQMVDSLVGDVSGKADQLITDTASATKAHNDAVAAGTPQHKQYTEADVQTPAGSSQQSQVEQWQSQGVAQNQAAQPQNAVATWWNQQQQPANPAGLSEAMGLNAAYGEPSAPTTPAAPAPAPAQDYGSYWTGTSYTGPADFAAGAGLEQRATDINTSLQNTQNFAGNQSLLQDKYRAGGQNYTDGQSRLDAALMGSAAGGQFDALNEKYGSLLGNVQTARASTKEGIAAGQAAGGKAQAVLDGNNAAEIARGNAATAAQAEREAPYVDMSWDDFTGVSNKSFEAPFQKWFDPNGYQVKHPGAQAGFALPRELYNKMSPAERMTLAERIKNDPQNMGPYIARMDQKYNYGVDMPDVRFGV